MIPVLRPFRLTREMLVRIVADALMINFGLLAGLALRFLYLVVFERGLASMNYSVVFWEYLGVYWSSGWLLTLLCLVVFYVSGFYTRGRAYRGSFKILVVAQAVSLGYLLYGFLSYFAGGALRLPRGAFVLAWVLSVIILVTARIWSLLWIRITTFERRAIERSTEGKVRNVLVIGGAGYIGSALLVKLLEKGYRVRVLDLLVYGIEPIQDLVNHPRLEVIQADFRQVDKVLEAVQEMDAVIHLGAIVGDPACALDEDLTIEVNLMATRVIAEVAKGSGVSRFIFASTCSVYGASNEVLDERSALRPVSLYARSKIASEKVLMDMGSSTFAPTILRFGTIYGLSGRTRFDLVVNVLSAKAIADGEIPIHGGSQWRPFLHVDDAALAVLRTLETPLELVHKQVFNVGSDEQNYTILQVGEIVKEVVPTARLVNNDSNNDIRNYRVNFGKIRDRLDFYPNWRLQQGVRQIVDAFENGDVEDYCDSRYSNVKFLSEAGASSLTCLLDNWAYNLIDGSTSKFGAENEFQLSDRVAIHMSDDIYQFWRRTISAADKINLGAVALELNPTAFGVGCVPSLSWEKDHQSDSKGGNSCVAVELPLAAGGDHYGTLRLKSLLNQSNNDRFILKRIENLHRTVTNGLLRLAERSRICPEVVLDRRGAYQGPDGETVVMTDTRKWDGQERRRF